MVSRTIPRFSSLLNPTNRVPFYQRLFQKQDGVRQWWKTSRSPFILYPFYASTIATSLMTIYGMSRMVVGKKTYFG